MNYICNRSNYKGYEQCYKETTEKSGGTIRIQGMCPSKLICKIYDAGTVSISFWKTHAGHDKELRTSHLIKTEKDSIINKLKIGVSVDRILEDARKLKDAELQRVNLIGRDEITYLARKHKRRDSDDMVAVALKVKELNANQKNFAFFYKQEGEVHEVLKKEDFALGFMNSVMEEKLKRFSNIICMAGTHGTNRKGLDLTIVLIKDDRNTGFPVAFFLTNRVDQAVQEERLGGIILANYFMSDDDPKYYDAWVKIMGNLPKRLLCTWHVVKNWNIQGKKKIKDLILRNEMKKEMKRIINETNEDKFLELVNAYLLKLQIANEEDFVTYLTRYYFQDEERIKMWAHCYRKNAGINTNMAIESLNNLLKTNQLKRSARATIEKLLDKIEELVDIKMWKRITAHKKEEAARNTVKVVMDAEQFGTFLVKSFKENLNYNVALGKVCESNCRTLYCRVCKICIHRYRCNCPEYMVKNTLCKHTNSVLDGTAKALGENSIIKSQNEEEIAHFLEEKATQKEPLHDQNKRETRWATIKHWAETLDNEDFNKFMDDIEGLMKKADQARARLPSKRKMETQEYYPTNKHHK
nr:unnamed protein product [Callosobruchus analis]